MRKQAGLFRDPTAPGGSRTDDPFVIRIFTDFFDFRLLWKEVNKTTVSAAFSTKSKASIALVK